MIWQNNDQEISDFTDGSTNFIKFNGKGQPIKPYAQVYNLHFKEFFDMYEGDSVIESETGAFYVVHKEVNFDA